MQNKPIQMREASAPQSALCYMSHYTKIDSEDWEVFSSVSRNWDERENLKKIHG